MTMHGTLGDQRDSPPPLSPEYVQGAIEGYLAAQPRYRCLRRWHLDALTKRLGDGAETALEDLLATGNLLRLKCSEIPGVCTPDSGTVYSTVRGLQDLAADPLLEPHLQEAIAAYLRDAGHPVTPTSGRTGDAVLGFRNGHLLGSPRKHR